MILVGVLLSSSYYNLFSKIKAFRDFSESLFACGNGGDESKRCHVIIFEILKNDEMCYIKSEIYGKCIKAISKFILIIS